MKDSSTLMAIRVILSITLHPWFFADRSGPGFYFLYVHYLCDRIEVC